MSIPKFLTDLAVIQKLADLPNSTDGLTADQLKAKFDEAPLAVQKYINETLIPALVAAKIPFAASSEIQADNIQDAIASVHNQIRDAVTGTLVNGSVTQEKLAPELLERVFGGRPWVSMNTPGSAHNVDAGFPIGQIWLKPGFTVTNAAGSAWACIGCTMTDGVVTGNQASATATVSQALTGIGQEGDRVLILFGISNRNAVVNAITLAVNYGEKQDAAAGVFEATLAYGGTLHVEFTTTWNSASLSPDGWTLENYTVVNLDQIMRQAAGAEEMEDWNGFVSGLVPFSSYVSPGTVFIQTINGSWWPLLVQAGDGEILLGNGKSLQTVGAEGYFLGASGGRPVWQNFADTVNGFGFLRMTSGSYTGTGDSRSVDLPVTPKLLFIAPEDGPVPREPNPVNMSIPTGYYDNPAVLLNGSKITDQYFSLYRRDDSISLSGATLSATRALYNRPGVTYHWVAIY